MIFTVLKNESKVQVNDKTRIDASKSYISGGPETITLIEIDPDNSGTFYDVTTNGYLDWQYNTNASTVIALRVTDSGANVVNSVGAIEVLSIVEDNLFSLDGDIVPLEDDLLSWVKDGRNSFLDKHREAQIEILNDLDEAKIWKQDGTRYVASDIVDIQEFKEWSKFTTLRIIFDSLSNDIDDVFMLKAKKYSGQAKSAANRAALRLDYNGDGEINEATEKTNLVSTKLNRR